MQERIAEVEQLKAQLEHRKAGADSAIEEVSSHREQLEALQASLAEKDESIHRLQIVAKVGDTRLANHRLGSQHLAIQVGRNHRAAVCNDHSADSAHGEHQRRGTTHPASSSDQRGRLLQPLLAWS